MIDYDEIQKKILAAAKTEGGNKDYLKTDDIGNTITGRFLPNLKDIENSVADFFHHGWTSLADETTKIFQLCPNTYKQKCTTCGTSIEGWKSDDPVAKENSKKIRRRQNWLVNFYVINDKKHPENNGTVKVLKYGFQIKSKFDLATTGDDKEIYGSKIWRLDDKGCNFRIKCEENSDSKESWPTYTNSSFLPSSEIEGMTDEKIMEILDSVHDLTSLHEKKTPEEFIDDVNKHYLCLASSDVTESEPEVEAEPEPEVEAEPEPEVEAEPEPKKKAPPKAKKEPEPTVESSTTEDEELDRMLKELQG